MFRVQFQWKYCNCLRCGLGGGREERRERRHFLRKAAKEKSGARGILKYETAYWYTSMDFTLVQLGLNRPCKSEVSIPRFRFFSHRWCRPCRGPMGQAWLAKLQVATHLTNFRQSHNSHELDTKCQSQINETAPSFTKSRSPPSSRRPSVGMTVIQSGQVNNPCDPCVVFQQLSDLCSTESQRA
jgi:hypothetical protein